MFFSPVFLSSLSTDPFSFRSTLARINHNYKDLFSIALMRFFGHVGTMDLGHSGSWAHNGPGEQCASDAVVLEYNRLATQRALGLLTKGLGTCTDASLGLSPTRCLHRTYGRRPDPHLAIEPAAVAHDYSGHITSCKSDDILHNRQKIFDLQFSSPVYWCKRYKDAF